MPFKKKLAFSVGRVKNSKENFKFKNIQFKKSINAYGIGISLFGGRYIHSLVPIGPHNRNLG